MEQLNRVELRGTVGSVYIKDFGTTRCVNFSVATNYCFKDREGCPVIETTWHRDQHQSFTTCRTEITLMSTVGTDIRVNLR